MNQHRFSEGARRLLLGASAVALAALTAGCEPIFAQIVVAAAPTHAAPGSGGRVIVREPWSHGGSPTAEIVVAGGSVIAPLDGVEFTCTPRETCSAERDLVRLLDPTPGLQAFDITVARAGFEPEHVKIDVAEARSAPFHRIFVMLKPTADGAAR